VFQPDSRYAAIEQATFATRDGRFVAYKRRRFLPQGDSMPLLGEATAVQGERIDLVANRTLGNPEHFWRICDANDVMDPAELLEPGRRIRVPVPQP
jgi:hypothetical protein